jgi:hypothetical protein
MMLRNDEKLKGPSRRTKGHLEDKEHLGMGSLCCNTLHLYCRQFIDWVPKTSRGILRVDRMSESDQEWRRDLKVEICRVFLHKSLSHWMALDEPGTYYSKSASLEAFRFKGL